MATPTTVADLVETVGQQEFLVENAGLANVRLEGNTLHLPSKDLQVDDHSLEVLGKFLGIPGAYLKKSPNPLRETNVNYWLDQLDESEALFETSNDSLVGVYKADQEIVPRSRLVGIVQNVMQPTDTIRSFNVEDGWFLCDVTTTQHVAEPRVGDVTEGGLRFKASMLPKSTLGSPYVASFLCRLACTNGMTHTEEFGKVRLKGKTVDQIIEEMEEAAQTLLSDVVPQRLEQWGHLTEVNVNAPEQFVHRLAREWGLSRRLESDIIEEVPELTERSAYDLVNLITGRQHGVSSERIRHRLQELGGSVIARQDDHRCTQCYSLLG